MNRAGSASYRLYNTAGFILTGAALVYAVSVLQPLLQESGCLFCSLFRALLLCLGLVYLLALLHNPRRGGQRFYALSGLLLITAGLATVIYYFWQHSLPVPEPENLTSQCQQTLDQLSLQGSLPDTLKSLFRLAGQCPLPAPPGLPLPIPMQALLLFSLLLILNGKIMLIKPRQESFFL